MSRSSVLQPSLALALPALTLAASLWAMGAHADVYRYTDEKGNVQYTDKPRMLPAELLRLQSKPTDGAAAQARAAAELKRSQELIAGGQKNNNAAADADKKAASELSEKDKAERCVKARERYDSYMNSQRLYKTSATGEREYLDDAALTESRNNARIAMEELCK